MSLEAFSIKWFIIYYGVAGLLLLSFGALFAIRPSSFKNYLLDQIATGQPPFLIKKILKYWLLFTILCLILSLISFSLPEFLFSLWSLLMIFLIGHQLVRWSHLREIISSQKKSLPSFVRLLGAIMMSVALIIFMLEYLIIKRSQFL